MKLIDAVIIYWTVVPYNVFTLYLKDIFLYSCFIICGYIVQYCSGKSGQQERMQIKLHIPGITKLPWIRKTSQPHTVSLM